ncbi:uncharacterized protein DSM5745_03438 [Aspergillus mulundensis]|uniref:F-box domain-containing protein n=1 Tax=Aspergillus mulundensis TaxID=1810919 RepID=A0A3D8SKI9_9EURO|nr:hypothetical protein DSM5745_03438 [Aspergillus mulundensis]RDW86796.1 hypothetical protein DSM5745_03438 [Aspergillus mulundensis]
MGKIVLEQLLMTGPAANIPRNHPAPRCRLVAPQCQRICDSAGIREVCEECTTAETGCCYVVRDAELVHRGAEYTGRPWYDEILWFEHKGKFANGRLPPQRSQPPVVNPSKPLKKSDDRFGVKGEALEHIAGPRCNSNEDAYKCSQTSIDEMRGCRMAQFLVSKEGDEMTSENLTWEPEACELEFEAESNYFLSGVCDDMLIYQFDASVSPARHGVWNIQAPGDPQSNFNEYETSLVFHSWCWGTWIQICKLRVGHIVVDRLVDWFDAGDHNYFGINYTTDDEDADVCDDNDEKAKWGHEYGYTVTNPFFVPRLQELIDKAVNADINAGPDPPKAVPAPKGVTEKGPFTALPQEIRSMILTNLVSKDIHNLRLAFPTSFQHLPNTGWKHLLQEDMPWVWEAWSSEPPYFWATVTQQDIEKHCQEDSVPGHTIDVNKRISNPPWAWKVPPHSTTDWRMLYENIKRETREIRGLRNRMRIWRNLEEAVKGVMGDLDRRTDDKRGHSFFGP